VVFEEVLLAGREAADVHNLRCRQAHFFERRAVCNRRQDERAAILEANKPQEYGESRA
jgi:hypothetical protein